MKHSLVLIGCTGAVLASGACGSTSDTRIDAAGEYALLQDRPAVLEADSLCVVTLLGAHVSLMDNGTYRSAYTLDQVCGAKRESLPDPGVTGMYRMRGDSVEFLDPAGSAAGSGVVRGDTLVVAGPVHTLTFVRSSPADSAAEPPLQ